MEAAKKETAWSPEGFQDTVLANSLEQVCIDIQLHRSWFIVCKQKMNCKSRNWLMN
jgi:hypothetical protein